VLWDRIKGLLPGREGDVGVTAKDNGLCLLSRYQTGLPWRGLPGASETGQACDLDGADILLPQIEADIVIADKGFDADERVIAPLEKTGKTR
jgi:hypothetical protein